MLSWRGDGVTLPITIPLLFDIVDAVRLGQERETGGAAWLEFVQAHQALTEAVRGDRRAAGLFERLLTAEYEMRLEEVRWCLEFLYSHLVSKYQGNLAEYLASTRMSAWMSEQIGRGVLGPEVIFISGETIREMSVESRRQRWLKGADGLLVADGGEADTVYVVGVVEIKSYSTTFSRISPQLEQHLERLQRGLQIGDQSWPRDKIIAVRWDRREGWVEGTSLADWKNVLRILVLPCPRGSRRAEAIRHPRHKLTLAVSHATLAAAAYELSVRFLESIGTTLFADGSPWPEMMPEEAATNALQEALYHILREERAGSEHAFRVAKRLYNVYGFGFDTAESHREMIWSTNEGELTSSQEEPPAAEPPSPASVKVLLNGAWYHYRTGELRQAESWVQAALLEEPAEAEERRAQWLLGMIQFYRAEYSHACAILRDPGSRSAADSGRWAKDSLTLVRARARSGQLERAEEILDLLARADLRWDYLSVALPTVKGWIAHGRGETTSVDALIAKAIESIEQLRVEQHARTKAGKGSPSYHDPSAIQAAIVDTAMLLAKRGQHDRAFALLRPLTGLFPPHLNQIAVDPTFERVRIGSRYQQWFRGQRSRADT